MQSRRFPVSVPRSERNPIKRAAIGEYRKCGILTPEFSWQWVDREMDHFVTRPQDPYIMTDDQRRFVREKIFPYWKGKSLEEAFLARLPAEPRPV